MSYLKRLLHIEVAAQAVLCGCAVLLSSVVLVAALTGCAGGSDSAVAVVGAGGALATLAYLYSVGPVALVIVPIYAFLEARGRCGPVTAAAVGMVPGIGTLIYSLTPYASAGPSVTLSGACMAAGASVSVGVYLVRTWRTEKRSAA